MVSLWMAYNLAQWKKTITHLANDLIGTREQNRGLGSVILSVFFNNFQVLTSERRRKVSDDPFMFRNLSGQTKDEVQRVIPADKNLALNPFFRLDALALSVIATATWLGGWLGGWLAVTLRYCMKTAKPIGKLFRPSESPIILIFWDPCADTKFQGEVGTLIGNHGCRIGWDNFRWPWVTPNPGFKVTVYL